jgi:arylsulfatase A-like enzyme
MAKTNLLVLFVDQLRKDALGPYGNRQVITPALDSLAQESEVFSNHFCSFPVCTPSRYSFLSGLYANEHGGWTNRSTLGTDCPTFPRSLKDNGYHTVAVGKMHCTPTYLDTGFEKMTLSEQDGSGRFADDYHLYLMNNHQIDSVDVIDQRAEYRQKASKDYFDSFGVALSNLPEEFHSTSYVTDQAVKQLEGWKEEGEALMVSYIKPHHPFDPSLKFLQMYEGRKIDLLPGYTPSVSDWDYSYNHGYFDNAKLDEETAKEMTRYYYASITQIDFGIKKIIEVLKARNLYDSTQIIFTSDHGDFLGFHHMALKQNHMYDPLLAIPLMIKYPNRKAGECSSLSDNTQIANEIMTSLGFPSENGMNCHDMHTQREYVLAMNRQNFRGKEQTCYSVRSHRFKLLVTGSLDDVTLFDLKADPLETQDLSDREEYRDLVSKMKTYLANELLFIHAPRNQVHHEAKVVSKTLAETEKQSSQLIRYYKDFLG